jgi:hypothetical protein
MLFYPGPNSISIPDIRNKLLETAELMENVFVIDQEYSVGVNWGGYSMVNATIQSMKYAWLLDRPFHYMQVKVRFRDKYRGESKTLGRLC